MMSVQNKLHEDKGERVVCESWKVPSYMLDKEKRPTSSLMLVLCGNGLYTLTCHANVYSKCFMISCDVNQK